MWKSNLSVGLRTAGLGIVPIVAAALTQEGIVKWSQLAGLMPSSWPVDSVKSWAAVLGAVYGVAVLSLPLALALAARRELQAQCDDLLESTAGAYTDSLRHRDLLRADAKINIRVFTPRVRPAARFPFWKRELVIKNDRSLAARDLTEGLAIQVFPDQQGVAGASYNTKTVQYDSDLERTNVTKYGFNEIQARRTSSLKFVMAIPVFTRGNKVGGILAFDSDGPVTVTPGREDELKAEVARYSQRLYDIMPSLFTRSRSAKHGHATSSE